MTAIALMIFDCVMCGRTDAQCPDCVNTIAIDPLTNLPPDVEYIDGRATHKTPDEAAKQRSRQQPLCDRCIAAAKAQGRPELVTAAERHSRLHEPAL
jgi:hypothetical protein